MARSSLTLKALGTRLARPMQAWGNRWCAWRSHFGPAPAVAERLPDPILIGDADRGQALADGTWQVLDQAVPLGEGSIWRSALSDSRLEAERQAFLWLDDLAALGNRAARVRAQTEVLGWLRRYRKGRGPGWQPELAGRRAKRMTVYAALLTEDLKPADARRFWRGLETHRRYLSRRWDRADPGLPRLRALTGLVWTGLVLPHAGHAEAVAELAALAEVLVDADGATPSRSPEELSEIVILLIWTARLLEDAGQQAMGPHLQAIVRAVPTLRPLRNGAGELGRFHGGGNGAAERLDQAMAELRLAAQPKPRLPMGYARLAGGRMVVVMDGAVPPPDAPGTAHAGTLAFELTAGRERLVVNAGSGVAFGPDWALYGRHTAAHSTVEVGAQSSADFETSGLAARTFGPRLVGGPALVSVRQAQDASGQWLLATQDGYVASHGLLQERRIFVDARGQEVRGEEILTVADARARDQFERRAPGGRMPYAVRFHLHPTVLADFDPARQLVLMTLPSGERWLFQASGGIVDLEDSVYFDANLSLPSPTQQVVVRAEVVEYLGQVTWSIGRIADPT